MGLTRTEMAIMAHAARRDSLNLLPLPRFIYVRGLGVVVALEKLIRHGLVAERQAMDGDPVWRTGQSPMTLRLTHAGLAALDEAEGFRHAGFAPAAATAPQYGFAEGADALSEETCHFVLMTIMSRPQGADVKLIQQETNLPLHSVRAAINGLRAQGYVFDHARDALGTTTYQLLGWLPGESTLAAASP